MTRDTKTIKENEGDTFSKTIGITNSDGTPEDISGWTFYVTVKNDLYDDDADAVLSDDITSHDDSANGQTSFEFTSSQMEGLSGLYWFEIKYEDTSGTVETIIRTRLEVSDSVRESTS